MAKPIDVLDDLLDQIAAQYGDKPPEGDEEVDPQELEALVQKALKKLD